MKGLTTSIVIAIFLLAFADGVRSGSVTSQLQIQAIVLPRLEFRIVHEKDGLRITKSDANRGYKEVKNGTIVSVTTNVAEGYIISIYAYPLVSTEDKEDKKDKKHKKDEEGEDRETEVYTYVTVTVDGTSFGVAPGSSVDIHMPASSMTNDSKSLSYKFTLSPHVEAGTYPLPITVTVYPL